jgi:hypothetical protein
MSTQVNVTVKAPAVDKSVQSPTTPFLATGNAGETTTFSVAGFKYTGNVTATATPTISAGVNCTLGTSYLKNSKTGQIGNPSVQVNPGDDLILFAPVTLDALAPGAADSSANFVAAITAS